jgi:hypothetical protein
MCVATDLVAVSGELYHVKRRELRRHKMNFISNLYGVLPGIYQEIVPLHTFRRNPQW